MSDYLARYVLMNSICVFGFLVLAVFTVVNILRGTLLVALVCTGMALFAALAFVLGRSRISQAIPGAILYGTFALMCIALTISGASLGANIMYIFMFPSLALTQFGRRYGTIASLLLIIIVSLIMFIPGWSLRPYPFDVAIRTPVIYFLLLFITIVIEITQNTKSRRIETQNLSLRKLREKTEEVNSMLETAVQERTGELEKQTQIALRASQAKSDFLATMSHEIRTPLNAVIGLSEIELQGRLPESSRNNIQQIYQSGSSLLGIINDILDISKIEAGGGIELVPAEYKTASFISDTIGLNRVRLGSKPITFVLEINGDFPKKLIGDELRVKQVLNNLLSNAIKYTEEGSVTLSVAWENSPAGRENELLLRFAVKDTGIGIRQADMNKMFLSYNQLDASTNRQIEGTGLGLAIAKNLVTMMGGTIDVKSEYSEGSVFTIEIIQSLVDSTNMNFEPIGEETAEALRNFCYVTGRKKEHVTRSWIPHAKVLIVDDLRMNLHVARGLLESYGLQIDTATSGEKAVELVKAGGYDIVFMDHMMPGMDGIEATTLIREWEKGQAAEGVCR